MARNKDVKGNSGGDLGKKKKKKQRERERPRECHNVGGSYGNDTSQRQASPNPARRPRKLGQGHGTICPSELTEGSTNTGFGLSASRAMKQYFSVVLSHVGFGNLLRQLEDADT